ncbi:MAG TPA: GWxTD domain-containing protein [Chryseosolibacter sp.]
MRIIIGFISLFTIAGSTIGQPLRDINYNYLYNPDETVAFQLKAIRHTSDWEVQFNIPKKDTTDLLSTYLVEWSTRETLSDKESKPFFPAEIQGSAVKGSFRVPFTDRTVYLVAKVINKPMKRAWIFFQALEPNHPVNASLENRGHPVFRPFVNLSDSVVLHGLPEAVVSYYNDLFPAAQPPFSESLGKVSKGMKTDSTFTIHQGEVVRLSKKGLYLIQQDTNSASGIAVRAEDDYPKLAKIASLSPPLVYITTAQEYSKLLQAKNDKKSFDRVILGITNDRDRASRLMRNYFRRVELANYYFTSYKEGWKTDRGMIYIVFGLPDEVFKFNDREVWNYSLTKRNLSFTFVKSSSVFDPDNYVLLRDQKFQQSWYETIDLWRGSRF